MNGSWVSSRTFSQSTGLGTSIPRTGSSSPWISVPCPMGQTDWYLRVETTILSKNTSWWVLRYVPLWTSRRRRQEGHFLTSESHKPSPAHPGTQRQLYAGAQAPAAQVLRVQQSGSDAGGPAARRTPEAPAQHLAWCAAAQRTQRPGWDEVPFYLSFL